MTARLLFVPVSGSAGTGEVQRCRLLAGSLAARAPGVEPHFVLAPDTPFPGLPHTRLSASPTRVPHEVTAAIARLRPAVVVFDGNARVASLQGARAAGARIVLISSRPSARDRGLRGRRMARLDEHWLVGAEMLAAPGWRERWARWRHPRVEVRRFATLFAPPAPYAAVAARLGLREGEPFALVCPGGGRQTLADGRSAARLFGAVARALSQQGVRTVAVACEGGGDVAVDALPNAELMALLAASQVAVLGGGSLLVQALALEACVLAVPLQEEQAARVRLLARHGAVVALPPADEARIAASACALTADADARAALLRAARTLGLRNGLDEAVDALLRLADFSPSRP